MKTMNIIRSFAAIFAVSALMAASCDNPTPDGPDTPDVVKPEFPTLVQNNEVAPGEVLTLTFQANMDWTVTVPSATFQWFWIQDGSFKAEKVSGKVAEGQKETVTVQIGVSDTEEFDMNRSCDVTLTMGGESKVIAKYMRPAKNRTISVYAAAVEGGELVADENGAYVYGTAEAASLDLVWSASTADFRMPVKVDANCQWLVETPEWLDVQAPENTEGTVELVFVGASVEAAAGTIAFKAGDAVLKELNVTVPGCGDVEVYAAQIGEDGEFMFADDGGYLYTTDPVEAVTLVWPGSDYRLPVMVDAKCDWTVELPEWLEVRFAEDAPAVNAGIVEFTLMGNPMKYPLEDTTGNIVFKFKGQTVHQIAVTIPGCKDRFSFGVDMGLTEWEFNTTGQLMTSLGFQDLPATAWIKGTQTASVFVVEMKDGKKVSENPEWITLDVQAYVQGEEVLQQRNITLSVSENTAQERTALLLFSKDGEDDSFFAADGSLNENMSAYAVSIVQHGSDMDYVTMIASESSMNAGGATFVDSENPRLTGWFGDTEYRYLLTYSNVYARDNAYMSFAKPYASYKVFNGTRKDVTSTSDFWLRFTPTSEENNGGVIDMYMDMTPSEKKETGYVVFYDADESVLAIIECVFDPEVVVEDVVVEFTAEAAQYASMVGASLEHLKEGPLFDQFSDGMYTVYHLTYRMEGMPLKVKIPATVKKHNVNPYAYRTFFKVNNLVYDEYFGPSDLLGEVEVDNEGAVEIYMNRPDTNVQIGGEELPANVYRSVINFVDRSDTVVFVLVCTLDLSE